MTNRGRDEAAVRMAKDRPRAALRFLSEDESRWLHELSVADRMKKAGGAG